MSKYKVVIDLTQEEFNWIINQSRRRLCDLSNLEQDLMEKIRELNSGEYQFRYQENMREMIGSIAGMYYDRGFIDAETRRPLLDGQERAYCELALGYFIQKVDLIPDTTPFMGYLDDYLLISLLHDQLQDIIAVHRESKSTRRTRFIP